MTYTSIIQRAQIKILQEEGYSIRQIAERLNIPTTTVYNISKRIAETGIYEDQERSGRPYILSAQNQQKVVDLIESCKCQTAVEIQSHLATDNINISANTIRRILQKNGFAARIKKKKPFLSEKHWQQRRDFANKYKNFDWSKVIWSDESKYELFGSSRHQYCWKKPGTLLQDMYVKPTVKYGGGSIMVWGCLTSKGIGYLCRIDSTLDGKLYRKILKEDLLNTLKWYGLNNRDIIFQHDKDPKHTANLTKKWFKDKNISILDWPAQSPDLNPIEHLWDEIDRRLRKLDVKATNKDNLWDKIQDIWNEVDVDVCTKLVETMPKRIQDVLKANGGYTKW